RIANKLVSYSKKHKNIISECFVIEIKKNEIYKQYERNKDIIIISNNNKEKAQEKKEVFIKNLEQARNKKKYETERINENIAYLNNLYKTT
ncbi:MAG TPA: hypothetical protein V6C58_19605, partial [Allocoleopsis sp.]